MTEPSTVNFINLLYSYNEHNNVIICYVTVSSNWKTGRWDKLRSLPASDTACQRSRGCAWNPHWTPNSGSLEKAAPTDAESPAGLSAFQTSLFLARYAFQDPGPKSVKACSDLSFPDDTLNIHCFIVSSCYSLRKRFKVYLIIKFPCKSIPVLVRMKHRFYLIIKVPCKSIPVLVKMKDNHIRKSFSKTPRDCNKLLTPRTQFLHEHSWGGSR